MIKDVANYHKIKNILFDQPLFCNGVKRLLSGLQIKNKFLEFTFQKIMENSIENKRGQIKINIFS
jgi:hypothetical protein